MQCHGVIWVCTCNQTQHVAAVHGGACHRADMVQRGSQLERTMHRHTRPGGFEAGHTICSGRKTDGAAGVCADGRKTQSRRDSHTSAARGCTRPMVVMPRVDGGRHIRMVVRKGCFGHGEFSEQHRARFAQALYYRAVVGGFEVAHHRHTGSGDDVFGVAQVFQCNRHTMQWAEYLATHDHGVRVTRLL